MSCSTVSPDLVSFVVPVYNVERYVDDCLRSIERQTYSNIEIVIVDDGSTDRSSVICQEHAQNDCRIVYLRKSNGGLSSARNYGIRRATGEWVTYVDSDDMVDERYVENLLRVAQSSGSVLAVCGFSLVGEGLHAFKSRDITPEHYKCCGAKKALSLLYSERYSCCAAWGKLAKSEVWRRVEFPEGRKFEDFSRIYSLISPDDSTVFLPWEGYAYRKAGASITSTGSIGSANDLAISIAELEKKLEASTLLNNRAVSFKLCLESTRLVRMLGNIAGTQGGASSQEPNLLQFACGIIKRHWPAAISDREASVSQRMRIALFRLSPKVGVRVLNLVTSGRTSIA